MGALDHRCAAVPCVGLSKTKSTGPCCAWCPDSNPRPRVTGAESSPLDDPCVSVGPVGIEPTSSGLRDRRITVSATVPCSRRERSRTLGHRREAVVVTLIRGPLSPLSYAPLRVGPKGLEPLRSGLQVRCAAVTPRPHRWSGVFVSTGFGACCHSSFPVVALRVELSATRLSAVSGQPALGYRDCQRRCRSSSSCGNRPRLSALKGQYPQPIDERAVQARCCVKRVGRCSNPGHRRAAVVASFSARCYSVSATDPNIKKPGVAWTPGFGLPARPFRPGVTSAEDTRGGHSPVDRQSPFRNCVP